MRGAGGFCASAFVAVSAMPLSRNTSPSTALTMRCIGSPAGQLNEDNWYQKNNNPEHNELHEARPAGRAHKGRQRRHVVFIQVERVARRLAHDARVEERAELL